MMDQSDTDPFDDGAPIRIERDEQPALLAMILGSVGLLIVFLLGFRCAIHRIEASLAYLTS